MQKPVTDKDVLIYRHQNGREPFWDWFNSIGSKSIQNRIIRRINRLEQGNFGDFKSLGHCIYELRLPFGSGYRIYFGMKKKKIVLLLCGGDKSTQKKDIIKAKRYWNIYNEQI